MLVEIGGWGKGAERYTVAWNVCWIATMDVTVEFRQQTKKRTISRSGIYAGTLNQHTLETHAHSCWLLHSVRSLRNRIKVDVHDFSKMGSLDVNEYVWMHMHTLMCTLDPRKKDKCGLFFCPKGKCKHGICRKVDTNGDHRSRLSKPHAEKQTVRAFSNMGSLARNVCACARTHTYVEP